MRASYFSESHPPFYRLLTRSLDNAIQLHHVDAGCNAEMLRDGQNSTLVVTGNELSQSPVSRGLWTHRAKAQTRCVKQDARRWEARRRALCAGC